MKVWKSFRVNMMYWRFRYITRNRLRLRAWWNARRRPQRPSPAPYRERGSALYAYSGGATRTRSWTALLAMVVLLTALTVYVRTTLIAPGLVYAVGALIVVGCAYWALRGV